MIWYSSDFHLGHTNILKYCNRPFSNVDEMNRYIYDLMYNTMSENDTLIHLGDLIFKGKESIIENIDNSGVKLVNLKGNHDNKNLKYNIGNVLLKYNFAGQDVILLEHRPSNECHHKKIFETLGIKVCICGHVHNNSKWKVSDNCYAAYDPELDVVNINVGLDCFGYKLVSEEDLNNLITHCVAHKNKLVRVFEYRDEKGNHVN